MSYQAQSQLGADSDFVGRTQSAAYQQAATYVNDQRPDFVAVAETVLRGEPDMLAAFTRLDAAGPGIADKADNGDGTIDQALVTDDDLLSLTQANWQVVAGLYYDTEGTPI